jgi:hypothetical protein
MQRFASRSGDSILRIPLFPAAALALLLAAPAAAQFVETVESKGPPLGEPVTQRWQAGLTVKATRGPCRGIVGYAPVPIDWPEQQVSIVQEDVAPTAQISYETVEGTVKLMVVSIPQLPMGEEARAVVTYEVKRCPILLPKDTSIYKLADARRVPKDVRPWLLPSPQIETRNPKIRTPCRKLIEEHQQAWDKVKALYDWTKSKVQYKRGPLTGASVAIQKGAGGDEDLTCVFIAACRACDIPARTVWVPGTCYAEFYLADDEEKGHWFPARLGKDASFGEVKEHRPVLEKGDNFRPPYNKRERQRFLAEYLTGAGGDPEHRFVRNPTAAE